MRKTAPLFLLAVALIVTATVKADTIHLKNGSVLKGKVASFADEQFVILLDTGGGRSLSRAMIHIGDVARIEFDSAPAAEVSATRDQSPAATLPPAVPTRENAQMGAQPRVEQTIEPQPRETAPPDPQPTSSQPEPSVSEKAPPEKTTTQPVSETGDADRGSRKSAGQVRTATVDVVAKRDWTSTGLIVKRGDRIRINSSGSVTLDPGSGQSTGPEGVDMPDSRKLMGDQPTGALIGVIGADNDDFIFIGRATEFTATRDGLLFLSVNEGALGDNTGSYKAIIEVQSQRK